ncbi:hypothetical protein PLESTM_000179300 [Pleodorina starrii]|nr:hypothetical protein PLESTM_000179300 [Pleodorina starrii]
MNLIYKGSVCHEANIWPNGPCPIEGACVPACSRCVNWRRGQLPLADPAAWLVGAANPPSSPPPSPVGGGKTPCDSTIWGFGRWRGKEWKPSAIYPQCSSALMSPPAIYQCLKGKRVTLFGDSMIRPLMGRLVAYLRDIPQYIDHMFHHPGGYYMANGTQDVFVEGRFSPSRHASFRATHPEHRVPVTSEVGWDPRVTLEMQMYWAPHFVRYDLDGRAYPSLSEHFGVMDGADIMVAGPMYHESLEYVNVRDELLSYFRKLAHARKRISHFFWVATIPFATSTFEERNYLMRTFVDMLNERALYGDHAVPKYSYYVDAARMARNAPVQRADEHHFQCNEHGVFPAALSSDMWGIAQNRDCRDVFNLNLMQSILKVACNA